MCAAPIGNRFWEIRSSHGRKPIFSTPEKLWDAACEYFEWNEANPLWETKSYMYQGAPVQDQIPKMRAMTIEGLCLFLDISKQAWSEYKQRDGFGDVTSEIDSVIRKQKFEGASADMLNANIIARDLGLRDQTSTEIGNKDGKAFEVNSTMTPSEAYLALIGK